MVGFFCFILQVIYYFSAVYYAFVVVFVMVVVVYSVEDKFLVYKVKRENKSLGHKDVKAKYFNLRPHSVEVL